MASESVLLHFAPCKMLQSVSTWNFKKRCCHLCGDRSCFSCGRSKAFKSIELSFGNARHCPHLNCCVQDSYANFFSDACWHCRGKSTGTHFAAASSHSDRERLNALSYWYHLFSKSIPRTAAVRIMVLQFTNCYLESSHGFVNLCN